MFNVGEISEHGFSKKIKNSIYKRPLRKGKVPHEHKTHLHFYVLGQRLVLNI